VHNVKADAGAALGALLLADAPALRELYICLCSLGNAGLAPVLGALRHNTHLTSLNCSANGLGPALARTALLPAVRANASLRELVAADGFEEDEEEQRVVQTIAREAAALVAARAQQPRA
jgi:hypothetical protein